MLIPVVLAAASMNAAMVAASAVSTVLIAAQLSPAVSGLPNTAGVLGTAAGAVLVGRLTVRLERPQALRAGYAIAMAGGALTVLAAVGAPVELLFVGMFLLGAGNAASLLSRYAAADAVTPTRRAAAMSTVVWAGTVGAVGGPLLLEPAQRVAVSAGLPPLSGAFLLTVTTATAALLAATHIHPTPANPSTAPGPDPVSAPASHLSEPLTPTLAPTAPAPRLSGLVPSTPALAAGVSRSTTVVAAGVMLVGHLVMVALMTSVPVHAHHHGHGLSALGMMLSAHTLGMFALAPLTGWWIDRAGPRPVMLAGLATVAASAVAVATPAGSTFVPALFLLGFGWNLCYLGGSALLAGPAGSAELESRVEAWVWAVSAIATATSTWLFTAGGFALLSTLAVILALPLLVLVALRRNLTAREAARIGVGR